MTTRYADTGAVRTAFDTSGVGPPLVLMHGAEASRQMFAALVPLLARRFTVVCYDQRDCGETDGPETASTLADLADDAAALIAALGWQRAHVFGSSFGGRVAQALALRHPECIDRLALGSTWALPQALDALHPDAARLGALRAALPDSAAELAGWFFPEAFLQQRPELRQVFAQVRPGSARSARRTQTVATTLDGADPARIAAPTLALAGELDRVVPPALTLALARAINGCRAVVLPGVGHATALQAPEALAAELARFLAAPHTEPLVEPAP